MITQLVITKKTAKLGENTILIIPKTLQSKLKPNTLVKVTFDIIGGN